MNFKETFIKLTEYTVPFGHEAELEPLLPSGYKKDSIGNYYYEIGNSSTLFTAHLDTASAERVKINHVIQGDYIKTDGSSILGGDNKAGCTILFYLIENMVPGTYYFFLGEESAVHHNMPHGSLYAIEQNRDFFTKFKRIISFDRKEMGQMVVRQLGMNCCSIEFADALISEFSKGGVSYEKDKTGYYTDGAFFGGIIPEIVNLSAGVYNEHTVNEYVNINYIEKVAKAAKNVNWEYLPTVRVPDTRFQTDPRDDADDIQLTSDQELFSEVYGILDELYFICHEIRNYKSFLNHFRSGRKYHFSEWHADIDLEISVDDGIIYCNNIQYDNIDDFKRAMGIRQLSREDFFKTITSEFRKKKNKLTAAEFNSLLYKTGGDIKKLQKDMRRKGLKLFNTGKGYEMLKEKFIMTYESFVNENIIKNFDFTEMIRDLTEVLTKKRISVEEANLITNKYNVYFKRYSEWYSTLKEKDKQGAPPANVPFFGYVGDDAVINIVIGRYVDLISLDQIGFIVHMCRHESIHVTQVHRRKIEVPSIDINNPKDYYSQKDEVMAFSRSIVDEITENGSDPMKSESMIEKRLRRSQLWSQISRVVDPSIKNRYMKYIYLYAKEDIDNSK